MQKKRGFNSGSNSIQSRFSTLDDALEIVPRLEKLADILKELGKRKHPLAIRKGVILNMTKTKNGVQIKGSGRTYFLDIQEAATGSKYLRITQSRKAEGENEFERISIFIFPEDAKEFSQKVSGMLADLN